MFIESKSVATCLLLADDFSKVWGVPTLYHEVHEVPPLIPPEASHWSVGERCQMSHEAVNAAARKTSQWDSLQWTQTGMLL